MNYSRQREMIYKHLLECDAHPTAEDVYSALRKRNPSLSMGTVYRNLEQLNKAGKLIRIKRAELPDRFDACIDSHYHGICCKCDKVYDIFDSNVKKNIDEIVSKNIEFNVKSYDIIFNIECDCCDLGGEYVNIKNYKR